MSVNRPGAVAFFFLTTVLLILAAATHGTFAASSLNSREECARCHPRQVNFIQEAGGRHRNVPCVGCHPVHPPDRRVAFVQCNRCHLPAKRVHFQSLGCITCHTNPHTPLKITFNARARCLGCHDLEREQMETHPSKHEALGCAGCHDVHRKKPDCLQCHVPHTTKMPNVCTQCHNPHMPLTIAFKGNVGCLNCHEPQREQLENYPSKHTNVGCAGCHDVHRKKPACTDCHKPHAAEMTAMDCKKCHQPHKPTQVAYGDDIPNSYCGACHGAVLKTLTSSTAKHRTFACVFCHQAKHGAIPQCQDCHGTPHPQGIRNKFPKCGQCHNVAHDLNNWSRTGQETGQAPPRP